jgi:hypothetical protein
MRVERDLTESNRIGSDQDANYGIGDLQFHDAETA